MYIVELRKKNSSGDWCTVEYYSEFFDTFEEAEKEVMRWKKFAKFWKNQDSWHKFKIIILMNDQYSLKGYKIVEEYPFQD